MFKNICIIILNWNGKEDTCACLSSLEKIACEKIVVDNGSTDNSVETIRSQFPHCTILETGLNLGYAGGNNCGIEYGLKQGFKFFFILNNDTTVDPQILEAFLNGFEKDPQAGILGAKILRMDQPNRLDHLGGMWNPKKLAFDFIGYREKDDGRFDKALELDYVCGAAVMVKREVFEKIGLFDPRFFLFWEESDLCFRAKEGGFSVKTCPEAKVWHKVSASFLGNKPHAGYFSTRNQLLWIEKNLPRCKRVLHLGKLITKNLFLSYSSILLRTLQKKAQKLAGKDFSRNEERIIRANSVLIATEDYLLRRFYAGRSKKFINC